jgi:hypothetical protein
MKKLFCVLLLCASALQAQSGDDNAKKGRAALDAMVKALGGDQWLVLSNMYQEGRISGYYQGKPTGSIGNFWSWKNADGQERVELGKKRDAIDIFSGKECWEATYKGKKALPQDICDEYIRRRDHSIEVAIKVWLKDPNTIVIYDGQKLAERHLADQVTLISAANESITIQMDADSHLPLSRTYEWRDPTYHDMNHDREEYANYHPVGGVPTAFSITRFHNDDEVQQRDLFKADYNVPLPPDAFNADAAAAKVKK